MIKRIWHGWTTPENADNYETVLTTHVIPGIEAKKLTGYRGMEFLRRTTGDEVEFITIMTFDKLENITAFLGENYETCYVPEEAQKVLKRWNKTAGHFEQRGNRTV